MANPNKPHGRTGWFFQTGKYRFWPVLTRPKSKLTVTELFSSQDSKEETESEKARARARERGKESQAQSQFPLPQQALILPKIFVTRDENVQILVKFILDIAAPIYLSILAQNFSHQVIISLIFDFFNVSKICEQISGNLNIYSPSDVLVYSPSDVLLLGVQISGNLNIFSFLYFSWICCTTKWLFDCNVSKMIQFLFNFELRL